MQGCHYLETWKNLEFDNLSKKNLENPGIWEILKKSGESSNFERNIFKNLEKTGIFNNFYIFSSKTSTSNKNSILYIKFMS